MFRVQDGRAHWREYHNIAAIVAVTAPVDGDQFLYYATQAEAEAARQGWPAGDNGPAYSVDLLVFSSRSRHE